MLPLGRTRSPARQRSAATSSCSATPLKGRSRSDPYVIGFPWWLEDPDPTERKADRFTGQARYAGIMLGYAVLALLGLRYFPPSWTTSPADVATSAFLAPAWLGVFRGVSALLVLAVILYLVFGPAKSQSESRLDGNEIFLRISGWWRLGGLTQSGWILVGLYMALASALTFAVWLNPDASANKQPSTLACAASSLLGVAFGFSLLITTVVTFVLVPLDHAAGHSVAGYFGTADLILHNANVALMTLEVLLGSLAVDFRSCLCRTCPCLLARPLLVSLALSPLSLCGPLALRAKPPVPATLHVFSRSDVAFVVLFGCAYLVWHQFVRYRLTRTLIYSFLSWQCQHSKTKKMLHCT